MLTHGLRIHINLSNTKKKIKDWESRLDGTHPEDNIQIFLQDFMSEVRDAVLTKYINTYSKNKSAIDRRTYALEHALDSVAVRQTSRFGWTGYATRHDVWPLGEGPVFYALFQEFGTSHGIKARDFLLRGDNYIKMFWDKELNKRLRKWSRS